VSSLTRTEYEFPKHSSSSVVLGAHVADSCMKRGIVDCSKCVKSVREECEGTNKTGNICPGFDDIQQKPKIIVSPFVRRQTADSPYSHYQGTWEDLVTLVEKNLEFARPGYRNDNTVLLVSVPPEGFFASTVTLDSQSSLEAVYAPRKEGERAFIQVRALGPKAPALCVDIVLYSRSILAEDNDVSDPTADYEIISINARTTLKPEPMDPMTMARNFLHLEGGTQGSFTAKEFAESILFWSNHCSVKG
jgi:hypothetical protein